MQQRYYDPIAGRFLSVDPVVTDANTGKGFGLYTYVDNNPYSKIDPDGRQAALGLCATGVGCAVGVAVTVVAVVKAIEDTGKVLQNSTSNSSSGTSGNGSNGQAAAAPAAAVGAAAAGGAAPPPPGGDDKDKGNLKAVKETKLEKDGVDAHAMKKDFVGNRGGQYNISVNSKTGDVQLTPVRRGAAEPVETGLKYSELAETYPLNK